MDRWRARNTIRLIDLLRQSYAIRDDPDVTLDERRSVGDALDAEMIRVWGQPDEDRG